MNNETFNALTDSQKVKNAIEYLGRISYKNFATKLGCSERSVVRWVKGSAKISTKYLSEIKRILTGEVGSMERIDALASSPLDCCLEEVQHLVNASTFPAMSLANHAVALKLCKHLNALNGVTLKLSSYFMYAPVVTRVDVIKEGNVKVIVSVSCSTTTKQMTVDTYDFNSGAILSSSAATDKGIVRTMSVVKKILHSK